MLLLVSGICILYEIPDIVICFRGVVVAGGVVVGGMYVSCVHVIGDVAVVDDIVVGIAVCHRVVV